MPSDDFPRLYEAQQRFFNEDLSLWLRLARARPGRILELGCGTGRVLLALAREGFEVAGLDANAGMLARASRNLAAEPGLPVALHHGDLRDFRLPGRYSLILVPCNTLSSLDPAEAAAALASARQHLAAQGLLAAELPAPGDRQDIADDEPIDAFEEPERGHPVQVYARQTWLDDPPRARVLWSYDELLPDGRVVRTQVPTNYFLRTPETMADLLHKAGFKSVAFFGDYDLSPLCAESPRLLVVAGRDAGLISDEEKT